MAVQITSELALGEREIYAAFQLHILRVVMETRIKTLESSFRSRKAVQTTEGFINPQMNNGLDLKLL